MNTNLVTITIGGDDMEFAPILNFCAFSNDCTTDFYKGQRLADYVSNSLNNLGPQLDNVYAAIHRQAPNARIIVAGYPQLFPSSADEQNCVKLAQKKAGRQTVGFSQKEQNFIRGQDSRFTQVIADHVSRAAGATFVPVDVIFQGHEVCGNSGEWINSPTLTKTDKQPHIAANTQSFHPNELGQKLGYAVAINGVLNGF